MAAKATKKRGQKDRNHTKARKYAKSNHEIKATGKLRIGIPQLGVEFYMTGYGVHLPCLEITETLDGEHLGSRFVQAPHPYFRATSLYTKAVLYREAFTDEGECFAIPCPLDRDEYAPGSMGLALQEATNTGIAVWTWIEGDDNDKFDVICNDVVVKDDFQCDPDFDQRLYAALLPDRVNDKTHPVYRRLDTINNGTGEGDYDPIWTQND